MEDLERTYREALEEVAGIDGYSEGDVTAIQAYVSFLQDALARERNRVLDYCVMLQRLTSATRDWQTIRKQAIDLLRRYGYAAEACASILRED